MEQMADDDYEEITLADLVDTLLKRKAVVIVTLLLAVGAGAALADREPVTYAAETRLVPLASTTIITSYLSSHQAAKDIVVDEGDVLRQTLALPDASDAELATKVDGFSRVVWSTPVEEDEEETGETRRVLVTIEVTADTPETAAAIAEAYLRSLENIRPILQELHEDGRFNFYFARTENLALNVTEARELAREDAQRKAFWLVFDDEADVEKQGGGSNLKLNLALGVVLGLMLGVFAAFSVEWWSNYRAERKKS